MTKPVFIHAGAHRTGTSSFQLCLQTNRAVLEAAGFDPAYPGRDGVPGGKLRLQLPRPRHGAKRVPEFAAQLRKHLARISPDPAHALILSDENIPGPMSHFYAGRFFPGALARAQALAGALDGPPDHLIYVLRPYAQLYVSAWRKRAEDNPVRPFPELVPHFLAMDRGWPELLADIQTGLKPTRLTVLPYARRGSSRELLRALVPDLRACDLQEPDNTLNLSATDAALIALQRRYHAGETLERAEWQAVLRDHADDTAPRGVAGFGDADRETLDARYARDLERVAGMPGLTLL